MLNRQSDIYARIIIMMKIYSNCATTNFNSYVMCARMRVNILDDRYNHMNT